MELSKGFTLQAEWADALGAPGRTTPARDRRCQRRCPAGPLSSVRLLARPSLQSFEGFITDLSRGGIGMEVTRPLELGTVLAIQLRKRHAGVSGILTAQVRHATRLAAECWQVGCRLSRNLTDAEIDALVHGDATDDET